MSRQDEPTGYAKAALSVMRKRYEYETVTYKCPGCGAAASQTWTKEMNILFEKKK